MQNHNNSSVQFPTNYQEILERVNSVDPIAYGRTRNFLDGSVSRLSPYISRGVISTRFVYDQIISRRYQPHSMQKLIQELAWRDYFQRVWQEKGDQIDHDLKHSQAPVSHYDMPIAILNASTGIEAIDKAIMEFYDTGYMHNHVRMYVASIACNIGQSHWRTPDRWLFYHLLDADWASNALSWQWVAGAFSNKKYVANQENINKYCNSRQQKTFLDVPYEDFPFDHVPEVLQEVSKPNLLTVLPQSDLSHYDPLKPSLIYNFYNLDPLWKKETEANRILLLEPSHFGKYPVSEKTISFVLKLAENIHGIEIFTGEFSDWYQKYQPVSVFFKEHPTSKHYQGNEEPREWLTSVSGYFPSFFTFWKKNEKKLISSH